MLKYLGLLEFVRAGRGLCVLRAIEARRYAGDKGGQRAGRRGRSRGQRQRRGSGCKGQPTAPRGEQQRQHGSTPHPQPNTLRVPRRRPATGAALRSLRSRSRAGRTFVFVWCLSGRAKRWAFTSSRRVLTIAPRRCVVFRGVKYRGHFVSIGEYCPR